MKVVTGKNRVDYGVDEERNRVDEGNNTVDKGCNRADCGIDEGRNLYVI